MTCHSVNNNARMGCISLFKLNHLVSLIASNFRHLLSSTWHYRNAAFEAVSDPEQNCSAPLLKVECSVSDRFLKRSESRLNTLSKQKLQRNLVLVNDLLKSKGSVANCMTDRARVHTGNASEQLLLRNRTLILVHMYRSNF